jgi:hypothetical protein
LVNHDAVAEGDLADVRAGTAVHRETVAALSDDLDRTLRGAGLLGQENCQTGRVRAAYGDPGTEAGARELRDVLVGHEPALFEGDDVIGGARGLLGVGRGEKDRAALGGVGVQHVVQPGALASGQSAGRIVEDEGVRVGQEDAGQAQAAVHAAGEGAEAFVAQAHEPDRLKNFIGTPDRDPCGSAQHAQMTADRAGGVPRHVPQQHAHLARGMGDAVQGAAPEVGDAATLLQFEHESENRRLAGARRSEQRGGAARARLEGDVVGCGRKLLAGIAGQSEGLDHL